MPGTNSGTEMGIEATENSIQEWNPMKEAYGNLKFNRYEQGPGAELDDEFQPASLAQNKNAEKAGKKFPHLRLKNVPKHLTIKALFNLLSGYGHVIDIRESQRVPFYFADFATLNDMERAYIGFKDNPYGIIVRVGNNEEKKKKESEPLFTIPEGASSGSQPSTKNEKEPIGTVDLSSRCFQGPFTMPERPPLFKIKTIVTEIDHKRTNLKMNDPQKHFLIDHDMHSDERRQESGKLEVTVKPKYPTGRHFYDISHKESNYIIGKSKGSDGVYKKDTKTFVKNSQSNLLEKIKYDKCIECETPTHRTCAKCGQFYCCTECTCSIAHKCAGELGLAAPTKEEPNQIGLTAKLPENESFVKITAILRTNLVFIRPSTEEDNEGYLLMLNAVNREGKQAKRLKSLPKVGDIVLCKFMNVEYNRALVLKVSNSERITVVYIDFGNIEVKKVSQLLIASKKCVNQRRFNVPVLLKDVEDFQPNDAIRQYMYSNIQKDNFKLVYLANGDTIEGEIIDTSSNESLNQMVNTMREIPTPKLHDPVIFVADLKWTPFPMGDKVPLYVYDNAVVSQSYFLSCIHEKDLIPLQQFNQELCKHAEKSAMDFYTPRENELVAVRYDNDGRWYRGKCIEVVGDGHPTIQFIDYGNISPIHISNIRKYPKEFTHPICTYDCELDGLPSVIDDKLGNRLKELLPIGFKILAHEMKRNEEENYYIIRLNSLLETLKGEGFPI